MILKHTRFFTRIYTLCFTRKIYKTIKVINTRKYASLEEGRFFTGGRKEGKMEDFLQETLIRS